MTQRLGVIAVVGLVATLAAGGFALSLRGAASSPTVSPTWGVFSDAQWRTLAASVGALGFRSASMKVVTAMPEESGKPFAIIAARRGGRTCFLVVRGVAPAGPICRLNEPVLAFTAREHDGMDVVGLARPEVESVVAGYRRWTQGSALLPAGSAHAFGGRYPSASVVLTAHVHSGAIVARLYCASALRGVCGMSAQRRS